MSKLPDAAVNRAKTVLNGIGARLKSANITPTEAVFSDAQAVESTAETRPAAERAEETLDRLGERLGVLAGDVSARLRKSTAFAREEAEDIWAEAQHLRRNGSS